MTDMLTMGMKGDFGLLTLPALSALPFAAQALHEIKSGAIRPAVFRTGRKNWIIGKVAGCVISGMLLQGAAVGLLFLILNPVRRLGDDADALRLSPDRYACKLPDLPHHKAELADRSDYHCVRPDLRLLPDDPAILHGYVHRLQCVHSEPLERNRQSDA